MKISALACVALVVGCAESNIVAMAEADPTEPVTAGQGRVETGQVKWLRNLDEAKQLSAKVDKPILVLFQEIPG